jgi:hypothetical protein
MNEVIVLGLALLVAGFVAVWSLRPRASALPVLQKELGGTVENRWLVLEDGMRIRRTTNGPLEAMVSVRAPGSLSVRTTASGLRTTGNAQLFGRARGGMAGLSYLWLDEGSLHVVGQADRPKRFVERVHELAESLEGTWLLAWKVAGSARGLRLEGLKLLGEMQGFQVVVDAEEGTLIEARGPLRKLKAVHADIGLPDATKTGLPVLDMCLAVATSEPVEEDLVEKLLPVLHAWPGSRVDHDIVTLSSPTLVIDGLGERIDEVVALAVALRA